MTNLDKKINLSNKIYPLFYGLSSDLIFFIAINTLFLTTVKGLTAQQINMFTTIGTLVALIVYLFSYKIIRVIGNLNSIKLGTLLILISSILFTISTNYILFILAEILYEVSFIFKSVDTVVLNNNLLYQNRESDFIRIKSQASTIYSVATLIASLVAGVLFNINPYIPMIICVLICLNNFILSHLIYEVRESANHNIKKRRHLQFSKIVLLTIIVYGLLYGTVAVCQTNDKLFMQYRLQEFLNIDELAVFMSIILFLSRISRLLSNLFFIKIYNKLNDKILYLINVILITSILLFILGKLVLSPLVGSIMMTCGFLLLLMLRDPTENVLSNILLKNTNEEDKEQAMIYFQFARRLVGFLISLLATLVLTKFELLQLYLIILLFAVMYLYIVTRLYSLVKKLK